MPRIALIAAWLFFGYAIAFADDMGAVTPGTRATQSGLIGCTYTAAGITLTTGQQAACQFDASGNLKTTGSAVVSGTVDTNLKQVGGAAIAIGQALSAASLPVVLPSDQTVATNLGQVGGVAVSLGQKVQASSIPVVLPSNQTVPVNFTQVSGAAIAIGQALSAASLPVVLPSDQTVVSSAVTTTTIKGVDPIGVSSSTALTVQGAAAGVPLPVQGVLTATPIPVTISQQPAAYVGCSGITAAPNVSSTLVAANGSRKGLIVVNQATVASGNTISINWESNSPTANAAGSITLTPGGSFSTTAAGFNPTNNIFISGSANAVPFTCARY